jgi:peptidoglycan/xylan/chitin deacetylase (PgdA/CDA1 family)
MRPTVPWPTGKQAAASLSFDFDAETVWVGFDEQNTLRPGVLSIGHYGARVGLPLILDILERRGIRATFFVVGQNLERYPELVHRIIADGHEIGIHGYTHTPPQSLTPAEEEGELVRCLELFSEFGVRPAGYRSPSWDVSPHTLDLLVKHGLQYSSQFMADIQPYWHQEHDLLELPIQWLLDDWPFFAFGLGQMERPICDPEAVGALWWQEFESLTDLGGHFILTMHPQVIGRPSRLKVLDELIARIAARPDIWFATCGEIAGHLRSNLSRGESVKLWGLQR